MVWLFDGYGAHFFIRLALPNSLHICYTISITRGHPEDILGG